MHHNLLLDRPVPQEGYLRVGSAGLYYRTIGRGQPIIILHGGPDFSHSYFLPTLDGLSDSFRLIYYDQRGRGKSADHVQPKDVSLASEIEDLQKVREHFQPGSAVILGHSWGGLLAMEYAAHHPDRVSHLILMNTAPASHDDYLLLRQERLKNAAADVALLKKLASSPRYQEGDPDAVADYYRIHFRATLRQPEHLESVIRSLRLSFTKEGILKAREIEDRLMDETWLSRDYNLLPRLKQLDIPTLVIHGDHDLVPVECAARIAQSIAGARFVLLQGCGHFSYLEYPDVVYKEIADFLHNA